MALKKSLGKELGMAVVLEDDFVMPNGSKAKIRVFRGKAGYGAVLCVGPGLRNRLPVSASGDTAFETLENAKRWLVKPIYGHNN